MAEEPALSSQHCSSSLPGRGCRTRGHLYDFLNSLWVCAGQPGPAQKRVAGSRWRAAINAQQDFRKAAAPLLE